MWPGGSRATSAVAGAGGAKRDRRHRARTPICPHAARTRIATATIPSSHQWLAVTTTTATVSTPCIGPMKRQRLGLIRHTVSYVDPATGATQQGTVQSVEITATAVARSAGEVTKLGEGRWTAAGSIGG